MRFLLFLPGIFFLILSWISAINELSKSSRSSRGRKSSGQKPSAAEQPKPTGTAAIKPIVIRDVPRWQPDPYSSCDNSAEDRWSRKAWKYLDGIEEDLAILLGGALSTKDIVNIQKIKNHILSQYDSYWKWTEKCSDDCESQDGRSYLWNHAREYMRFKLSSDSYDTGITIWWGVPSNKSVREQLEKRLNDRLEELRPEHLRKKKLIKDIIDAVAAEETILRADLMKLPFDAVSEREVSSVYRVLIKTGRLFETKVGSRYIVSLSDKELARKQGGQKKAGSKSANVPQCNPGKNAQNMESEEPEKSQPALHSSPSFSVSESVLPSPTITAQTEEPAPIPEAAQVQESVEAVKEKADFFLTGFFANYFSIVLTDGSFSDADNLPDLFSQCLRNYDGYNQLNLKERFGIDPLEYMKVFIGDRYDPCMSSRRELEMRLGSIATKLGPMKERREKLDSLLLRRLSEENQIPVSELFHHPFDGYTLKEIEYCYNALKKSGRIVGFHIGKDTYIRLPQTGKAEDGRKRASSGGITSPEHSADIFTKTDLIAFLDDKNIEYVDKTPSGGCLWIPEGPNVDSVIREFALNGAKPIYASSSKALSQRPGWYIKPSQKENHSASQAGYSCPEQ